MSKLKQIKDAWLDGVAEGLEKQSLQGDFGEAMFEHPYLSTALAGIPWGPVGQIGAMAGVHYPVRQSIERKMKKELGNDEKLSWILKHPILGQALGTGGGALTGGVLGHLGGKLEGSNKGAFTGAALGGGAGALGTMLLHYLKRKGLEEDLSEAGVENVAGLLEQ